MNESGRMSGGAQKDNDFTVSFLKDQLKFVNERLRRSEQELLEKEGLLQKIEHEKREV